MGSVVALRAPCAETGREDKGIACCDEMRLVIGAGLDEG